MVFDNFEHMPSGYYIRARNGDIAPECQFNTNECLLDCLTQACESGTRHEQSNAAPTEPRALVATSQKKTSGSATSRPETARHWTGARLYRSTVRQIPPRNDLAEMLPSRSPDNHEQLREDPHRPMYPPTGRPPGCTPALEAIGRMKTFEAYVRPHMS